MLSNDYPGSNKKECLKQLISLSHTRVSSTATDVNEWRDYVCQVITCVPNLPMRGYKNQVAVP